MSCLNPLRAELARVLGWPATGQIVVVGSAVMKIHGIKREIGDVDLFTTPSSYMALKDAGWDELYPDPADPPMLEWRGCTTPAHAWCRWNERHMTGGDPIREAFASCEVVNGWPCQSLTMLQWWKALIGRPKDLRDCDLIAQHLAYLETGVRR